jgi:multidrug efflux pump subunit AcrB/ABC-type multidrug transport system ATPase subunit
MTTFALKRPITVFMATVGLCLLGVISWQRLAVQLLPQFILPEVYVGMGRPGASPEQIEQELVLPVEGEIAALEDVRDVETRVSSDYASIKISYNHGTNMKFALLKLQQRMNAVENRLGDGTQIEVNRFDTADLASFLMQLNIRGDASLETLREVAERQVRRRLEGIDGVVNVNIGGGEQRTVGIQIDPDRCDAMNIPMTLVQQKVNAFHREPEHMGRVISAGKIIDVILWGRLDDLNELSNLIIEPARHVRLRDVATVGYAQEERTQLFRVDGKAGVGIFIQKDNTSNMLQVAQLVLKEIENLNEELIPQGYELVVNFSQAQFVDDAISRVEKLALSGAVLAIIMLYLFLRNIRFVGILMIAIPVSLLVTFNVMYGFNLTINILSLCGLALAIGMLVDNGIVVMENVFLHHQRGKDAQQSAFDGTREVGRSILAATATTILVFLPVLFVESDAQLFVRELALSVMFPLVVSLVVALTVIPLLSRRALAGKPRQAFRSGRVMEIYRLLLKSAIRHRVRTVSVVIVFMLISLFIGVTFILTQSAPPPPSRLDAYLTLAKGATLDGTDLIVRRFEDQILALPDVKELRVNVRPEEAHLSINFLEPAKRTEPLQLEKIKENLRRQNERIEGVSLSFERFQRGGDIRRGDEFSAFTSSEEALRLRGQDMTSLRALTEQITQTLRSIEDIDDESVNSDLESGAPELQIRGDRLRLALWGLEMQGIMNAIWATRAEGTNTATPFSGANGEMDINLGLANTEERQLEDIQNLKVANQTGHLIPLGQVADVRVDIGSGNIVRHNQERQVKISYAFITEAQKSKARLETAKQQIARFVQELRMPRGFTLEKVEPENKQKVYYWMIGIGALLIYMYLAAQFESLSTPLIVLGTVPTAIIGALFALSITGTPLSMGEGAPMALLGLLVLLGIVVNNGIILLDRIAILRNQHGYRWQRAVLLAGQSRVRPIIMTSGTTVLGLFPLALKQGTEFELWPPFAITVLGGLAVSSIATLVFIPVLYVGMEQTKTWLKKIGWPGIVAATVVSAAAIFWFHKTYQSVLYTCLLVLPIWFGLLGMIYAVQQFLFVRKEKQRMAEESLTISIKNLTKIYGAPGRFAREWSKNERRMRKVVEAMQLPWDREHLKESTIWMTAIGILLVYLHFFFSNGFWLCVLSLLTLAWLFAAREIYYRWRFVKGKVPGRKGQHKNVLLKKGRLQGVVRFFRRNKDNPLTPFESGNPSRFERLRFWKKFRRGSSDSTVIEPVTPLNFPRRGTILFCLLFIGYLQLRIESPVVTIIAFVILLLIARLYKIGRKIERGEIDPELPSGRLRKIKRLIYNVVRALPVIRPPKKQVTALHGVDLEIGKGMFGLLGPNGAGKTTLMRILVGVLNEDRGSVKVNEHKLSEHREIFHGAIGYLPQDFGLYENMTPLEYLNYHALTNGIYEPDGRSELISTILKNVGLWERRDDKIKTFSGGMKQRVGIAQTLLHLPQIIVVDEPTAGLDPRERIRFRNLLSQLAKDRIVVFSTHIVEDISSTCHDVAVLNQGRLIYRGSPEEMEQRAVGKVFEAILSEEDFVGWQSRLQILQHSETKEGVRVRFLSEQPIDGLPAQSVEPTLEDAYVYLLNRSAKLQLCMSN